jgi:hypothetical protein
LVVIPIALALALIVGIVLRIWSVTLPPVVFANVTPPHASAIVASFLEGVSEPRFGFPSGLFRIHEGKEPSDERITVREFQPTYSVTDGCAAMSTSVGVEIIADADGCLGMFISLIIVTFVTGPIWVLNLTEKGFRRLLESEVRADFIPVEDPEGTEITIRLRGISAILLRSAYEEGLFEPQLPEDIAIAAGITPPPTPTTAGSETYD